MRVIPSRKTALSANLPQFLLGLESSKTRRKQQKFQEETMGPYYEAMTGRIDAQIKAGFAEKEVDLIANRALLTGVQASRARQELDWEKDFYKQNPKGFFGLKMAQSQLKSATAQNRAMREQILNQQTQLNMLAGKAKMQQDARNTLAVFDEMTKGWDDEAKETTRGVLLENAGLKKKKATPTDAGVFNILKRPRGPLSFEQAFEQWESDNITDEHMWRDWRVELESAGYSLNKEQNAITGPFRTEETEKMFTSEMMRFSAPDVRLDKYWPSLSAEKKAFIWDQYQTDPGSVPLLIKVIEEQRGKSKK